MGIIRDSFVMFKNWFEAIDALPEEFQLEAYKSLSKYGLSGVIPEDISPVTKAILISFSKGMENNIARYNASVENGKKGGRPKKEQIIEVNEETQQPSCENENLEKPNETHNNLTKPTQNLNVNVNDNVNVKDNVNEVKLVNKINKINCFESYDITHAYAHERVPKRTQEERQPFLSYYREFFDYCYSDTWKDIGYEIIDTMIEAKEQSQSENGLKFNQKKYDLYNFSNMISKVDCDHFRSIVAQLKFNEEIKNRPIYILGCIEKASADKFNKTTKEEMDALMKELGN